MTAWVVDLGTLSYLGAKEEFIALCNQTPPIW